MQEGSQISCVIENFYHGPRIAAESVVPYSHGSQKNTFIIILYNILWNPKPAIHYCAVYRRAQIAKDEYAKLKHPMKSICPL
jgi:hypothetical protein